METEQVKNLLQGKWRQQTIIEPNMTDIYEFSGNNLNRLRPFKFDVLSSETFEVVKEEKHIQLIKKSGTQEICAISELYMFLKIDEYCVEFLKVP